MKRILVVLFVVSMFVIGSKNVALSYYYDFYDDNFGELNVKIGAQLLGKMDVNYKNPDSNDNNGTRDSNWGGTFTVEYLISCKHLLEGIENLKFGAGLSYLLPRGIDTIDSKYSYSYLPIYFALQVNPFMSSFDEYLHGIFIKGNIGYDVLFDFKVKDFSNYKVDNTGGIYYGFFAGYEFQFGLIFDLGYNVYKSKSEVSQYNASGISIDKKSIDFTCSNVTLSLGYKFKI
jgi:hypothetical protein